MKRIKFVIALLLLCALNIPAQQAESARSQLWQHRLMPVPASIQFQAGRLKIDASFSVAVSGHTDARLAAAIHRVSRRLEGRTGFEFSRELSNDRQAATLVVECQGPGKDVPSVKEEESYSLDVSDKQAALKAATVVGAIRG